MKLNQLKILSLSIMIASSLLTACTRTQRAGASLANEAATDTASTKAKDAALKFYIANASGIQGSDPVASVELISETAIKNTYETTINDQNDDGESWTTRVSVDIRKDLGSVHEIRQQIADIGNAAAPSNASLWTDLAKTISLEMYEGNAEGIQGSSSVVSEPTLVSADGRFSIYDVVISDRNDEGESWQMRYTIKMANESPLALSVTETPVDE